MTEGTLISPYTMIARAIIKEIKPLGSESYKKILLNHGVTGPCFGVKIQDLKKIEKRIKKNYRLALDLYDTGIYDAMYLAGLIADDEQMTKKDLQHWVEKAYGPLAGSTVPWVAAGSPQGGDLALRWIESPKESVAVAGWTTLSSLVSIKDDAELDQSKIKQLLQRVKRTIHEAPNAVRYAMNGFVIAVGSHVRPLTDFARQIGEKIGQVTVDMGDTACQVPFAPDYIRKVEKRGAIGKKRKSAKC
jgi:3-methyladenine DNA glycosylase AlkD